MYWLDLIYESELISTKQYDSMLNDVKIITGTLVNIINKMKNKQENKLNKRIE